MESFPQLGAPANPRTEARILFDDRFLYVSVTCFDPEPERIVRQLGRRDLEEEELGLLPVELTQAEEQAGLKAVRASCLEVYGDDSPAPAGARVHFRGDDPEVGLLTKYSMIEARYHAL